MFKRVFTFFGLIVFAQTGFAQNATDPDSIALKNNIPIEKQLIHFDLYDYGITHLDLNFKKVIIPGGDYYYGDLKFKSANGSGFTSLTLKQVSSLLHGLNALLKIDRIKDMPYPNTRFIGGNKIKAGTAIWREKKEYYFSTSTNDGGFISFKLNSQTEPSTVAQSLMVGVMSGDFVSRYSGIWDPNYLINNNTISFKVNDFAAYRRKVETTLNSFLNILDSVGSDKNLITDQAEGVVNTTVIDFRPLIENGIKIYKSNIQKAQGLDILANISIVKTQKSVPLNEYKGNFNNYSMYVDPNNIVFIKEDLSATDLYNALIKKVKDLGGNSIINPTFSANDSQFKITATVAK